MKVALYGRVSTERQEKQETIQSQLEALREFIKKNGYECVGEYIDDGYSGALLDRPALDRLRDDAKKKLFEAIVIHSPDRLSREYWHRGLVESELKKLNITFIFLNRPENKDTPEDKLLDIVQSGIAEYEKAKILERTRRGKVAKAKRGQVVASIAPYGYTYVPGDRTKGISGRYEICEKEAQVVRLIFDMLVNKRYSVRRICKELFNREIPSRISKVWRTSSMHKLIRNETYAGKTYYNKHISFEMPKQQGQYRRTANTGKKLRPRNEWIPITLPESLIIIDRDTFDRAQRQLIKNSEMSPRHVKYQYLLRGLVKCGKCGSPMYGVFRLKRFRYRCNNKVRTFPRPKTCKVTEIIADSVESVVWSKFCEAIQNPKLIYTQIKTINDKAIGQRVGVQKAIEDVDHELQFLKDKADRLLDAYREQIINKDQLRSQMSKVEDDRKRLEFNKQTILTEHDRQLSKSLIHYSVKEFCAKIKKRLKDLENDFDGKRYLLSLAINQILLDRETVKIRGIIPIYQTTEQESTRSIASTLP